MNGGELDRRLTELRRDFDEAFALPFTPKVDELVKVLLIMAGGQRYAIRISELAGLEVNRRIVPVPASLPGLRGLSAVRGQLVPVFELAALLGGGSAASAPRWLALPRGIEPVGLGFEEYLGYSQVEAQAMHSLELTSELAPLSRQTIQVNCERVHLLDLPVIVSNIGLSAQKQTKT